MSNHDSDDDFLFTTERSTKRRKLDLFETPAETSTAGFGPLTDLLDTKLMPTSPRLCPTSVTSAKKVDEQLEEVKTYMQSMLEHVIELTMMNERMHVHASANNYQCGTICPPTPPLTVCQLLQGYNCMAANHALSGGMAVKMSLKEIVLGAAHAEL